MALDEHGWSQPKDFAEQHHELQEDIKWRRVGLLLMLLSAAVSFWGGISLLAWLAG